jgi:hypothetical protein
MPNPHQNPIKTQLTFLIGMLILYLILYSITLQKLLKVNLKPIRYPGMNIKEF